VSLRNEFSAPELILKDFRRAMEVFRTLGNRRLIRLTVLEHDRLDQVFENEYGAARVPVADVPELPARDVEARPARLRQ
jgi:hypothetical protein